MALPITDSAGLGYIPQSPSPSVWGWAMWESSTELEGGGLLQPLSAVPLWHLCAFLASQSQVTTLMRSQAQL